MATAIGLDIGSSAVRAVQLHRGRDGVVVLDRIGQVILEPGAVEDGLIVQAEPVTEALRILWQQFGLKGRKVGLGLANQQVIVRPVDLPLIQGDDVKARLRMQAQDFLPVPMDDVEFDHELVEEFAHEDGTAMMRVLLVAADKQMVADTIGAVKAAKLTPVVLDLDAFAQVRALRDPVAAVDSFGPATGHAIVNVGANLTSIVIHTAGTPRFVRTVNVGGDDITESLSAAFDMTWEQAETIKSVTPGASSPYTTLLDERIAWVVEEIRSSMNYYRTVPGAVAVEDVVLTGGSSLIPDLTQRLSQALSTEVRHGQPFRSVTMGDVPLTTAELDAAQPFFAVAMGLALRVLG